MPAIDTLGGGVDGLGPWVGGFTVAVAIWAQGWLSRSGYPRGALHVLSSLLLGYLAGFRLGVWLSNILHPRGAMFSSRP